MRDAVRAGGQEDEGRRKKIYQMMTRDELSYTSGNISLLRLLRLSLASRVTSFLSFVARLIRLLLEHSYITHILGFGGKKERERNERK